MPRALDSRRARNPPDIAVGGPLRSADTLEGRRVDSVRPPCASHALASSTAISGSAGLRRATPSHLDAWERFDGLVIDALAQDRIASLPRRMPRALDSRRARNPPDIAVGGLLRLAD